jgi:hypothetical protein
MHVQPTHYIYTRLHGVLLGYNIKYLIQEGLLSLTPAAVLPLDEQPHQEVEHAEDEEHHREKVVSASAMAPGWLFPGGQTLTVAFLHGNEWRICVGWRDLELIRGGRAGDPTESGLGRERHPRSCLPGAMAEAAVAFSSGSMAPASSGKCSCTVHGVGGGCPGPGRR